MKFGWSRCHSMRQLRHVEVAQRAHAPVKDHGPVHALVERVLDDRLDRREAGAARDEDHRLVGILAQVEGPERAFEAQDRALLHLVEHEARERAARRLAHVQLEELVVVRRVGHREAAPLAVLQQDVDVLPGEELQPLAGRKLQVEDGDILGGPFNLFHARGHRADREVLRAGELAHLEDDVGERMRAAGERLARGLLVVVQRALLVLAVLELARAQHALAGAARAVAASVGQPDPWRSAASRMVSPGATGKVWPLGSRRTWWPGFGDQQLNFSEIPRLAEH